MLQELHWIADLYGEEGCVFFNFLPLPLPKCLQVREGEGDIRASETGIKEMETQRGGREDAERLGGAR